MNYYEEFGLEPGASSEEVRQAYRTLVRLLHPDTQADARLRAMAERQMKRLNEILATLTDPQRRREYDHTLRMPALRSGMEPRPVRKGESLRGLANAVVIPPAKQPDWRQAATRHWFHVLIGLAWLATAIGWYAIPRAQPPAAVPAAAVEPEAAPPQAAPARPRPSRPRPARRARRAESKPKQAAPTVAAPAHADTAAYSAISLPPPEPLVEPAKAWAELPVAGLAAKPAGSPFTGSWLYAPQSKQQSVPGRYRAVYIECLLREEAGEIVGTYRAKYKIPDQAISPEVAFRVRGAPPTGNSGRVVWTASDGASGMLELTLHSPGAMGVVWWTTTAGRRPTLSSGEAVLIRQIDRPGGL